jgi:hypothetical protein
LGRALLTASTHRLGAVCRAAPGSRRAAAVWGAFALLLVLVSAPVSSTVLPPLFDYPNHLARMHLIAAGGDRFYAVRWAPLPNLAEDLIVPPLSRLMPLAAAGRLFLVMIFAAIAGGALWLNRAATGGWRMWPLAAFLLLYNRTFLWGFLNYLFGLGAALNGAALWLALEGRRPALRVAVSSFTALFCFFCHLVAFGIYAVTVCGVELPRAGAELRARHWPALGRRAAIFGAQFVIPAALFVGWRRQAVAGISYAGYLRKFDLLFSVFDNYSRPFDVACFASLAGLLIWLAWTGRLGLTRRLGVAAGLLFAVYLVSPSRLYGGSGLDHRLPPALFLLLIAGSAPRFPDRRLAVAIGTAVVALLVLRIAVIERVWLRADRIYSADLAGIDRLPKGVRLAVAYPADSIHVVPVPEVHLPAMAVIRRGGFVPTLFAVPGQQPLALRPRWAAIADAAQPPLLWAALTAPAKRLRLPGALAPFNAVVLIGRRPPQAAPNPCLRVIFAASSFRIFAVRGCTGADRD